MTVKANRMFSAMCELVDVLVNYSEDVNEWPFDADRRLSEPKVYRFVVNTPKQKAEAIITMLFGQINEPSKVGNRSFQRQDMELMKQCKQEMDETGATRESLLQKYIDLAQMRNPSTTDESIRARLIAAFQLMSHQETEGTTLLDYSAYGGGDGFENFDQYDVDVSIIWPWLHKHRDKVINLLGA
jgi:hypothetical protein